MSGTYHSLYHAELTRDELTKAIAQYVIRRDNLSDIEAYTATDCIYCTSVVTGASVVIEKKEPT